MRRKNGNHGETLLSPGDKEKKMIIVCISDLHGHYPKLEGGDLLIVAGDLTARDTLREHDDFVEWVDNQKYKKKIFIAGNHDNCLIGSQNCPDWPFEPPVTYLCDSETEFEGLKIWGSPWTKSFKGMNPRYKAFTLDSEQELEEKWKMIPEDTDILITHSPPYGIFDEVTRDVCIEGHQCDKVEHVGSHSLLYYSQMHQPKLHVFGHIHESYGMQRPNLGFIDLDGYPIYVNASHVNVRYQPVNKPVRIVL